MYCHRCGFEVGGDQRFCAKCGAELIDSKINNNSPHVSNPTKQKQKVVPNDQKTKILKITVGVIVVLVLLVTVTNIHRCPECEEIYFGKSYTISWFGEKEKVCKDCYKSYYLE